MADYFIIGGDGKEYGPVTDADVRQWITEERLNGQSLAKAESDAEFRPLAAFPEFADALNPGAPAVPPPLAAASSGTRDAALKRIKGPATALKITGLLNVLFSVWSLVKTIFFPLSFQEFEAQIKQLGALLHLQLNDPQFQPLIQKLYHLAYGPVGIASDVLGLVLSLLILLGAAKMQSLRSYEISVTAAILALLPCLTPCCLLGLPVGIWALIVLRQPGVKSQFH